MSNPEPGISLDDLKARAAALGVPVKAEHWEAVHAMVERPLSVLRDFDTADLKALEPAVTFRPAR